jgi:hypothetical protein
LRIILIRAGAALRTGVLIESNSAENRVAASLLNRSTPLDSASETTLMYN